MSVQQEAAPRLFYLPSPQTRYKYWLEAIKEVKHDFGVVGQKPQKTKQPIKQMHTKGKKLCLAGVISYGKGSHILSTT